MYREVTSK